MFKFTRFIRTKTTKTIHKYFCDIGDNKNYTQPSIGKILEDYKNLFDKSKILENILPRKFQSANDLATFFDINSISPFILIRDKITLDSINNSVNAPIWDLLDRGGKRWRPLLGLMVAKYLDIEIEDYQKNNSLYNILGCIEILHNATLIIDDVIDNSDYRRNKPCTYKIFGNN